MGIEFTPCSIHGSHQHCGAERIVDHRELIASQQRGHTEIQRRKQLSMDGFQWSGGAIEQQAVFHLGKGHQRQFAFVGFGYPFYEGIQRIDLVLHALANLH